MAGSILGRDQVAKVNAAYVELRKHILDLLSRNRTAHDIMKVHLMVEHIDTTELALIFQGLSFISPNEKRSLVRTAIYEVLVTHPEAFVPLADQAPVARPTPETVEAPKVFVPAQFKLNVATTENHQGTVEKPAPAAEAKRPTALLVVENLKQEAAIINAKAQAERDAAIAKLRAAALPEEVGVSPVVIEEPVFEAESEDPTDEE